MKQLSQAIKRAWRARMEREYQALMTDPVAAKRLRELMPDGLGAYSLADLEACIARAKGAVQAAHLRDREARLWE